MKNRTIYDIEANLRQVERELLIGRLCGFLLLILFIVAVVIGLSMLEAGFTLGIVGSIVISLLCLAFLLPYSAHQKKQKALMQELKQAVDAFEAEAVKFTVEVSGMDADEWHFSGGRKKKKKREESEDEYLDDSEGFNQMNDED